MPPKPKKNEGKQDFLKRCTGEISGSENNSKDAFAMCNLYWDQERKQRSALSLKMAPEIKAAEGDSKKREFLITAYTGKKIQSWWRDLIIDISGIQTKEKLPILREHARDRVVGFGNAWKKDNLYISGTFSQSTEDAKEVLALADEGYPWQASIFVMASKIEELKDEKTKAKVNGETVFGPLEIWRESTVGEVSFVSLGADDDTAAITMSDRKFDVEILNLNNSSSDGGEKGESAMKIDLELLKKEAPELLAAIEKAAKDEGITAGMTQGVEKERTRVVAILKVDGDMDVAKKCIEDGIGLDASYKLFHDALKTKMGTVLANHQADAPDPLIQPAAGADPGQGADDQNLPIEDRCKKAWDKDPGLRKEFGNDFDGYLSHEKAVAGGQVRVLKPKAS